jgi:putative flavoprotein involved in K+ transport
MGVQLRGRLGTIRDGVGLFSGGLRNHCVLADQKLGRLLDDIDEWITVNGLDGDVGPRARPEPTVVAADVPLTLDLRSGEIRTIVWATGFAPDLSWLDLPVFDDRSRLRHDGGVVDAPGVYLLGATFLRRRKSSFIHGAGDDTTELADHLAAYLAGRGRRRAVTPDRG